MKNLISFLSIILLFHDAHSQEFDFYGPAPFGEILDQNYSRSWTTSAIPSIENKSYVILLDQATHTSAIALDPSDNSVLNIVSTESIHEPGATYGSLFNSIFQIVDVNTHLDNSTVSLDGKYRLNPMLHSYFGINADESNLANCTDAGTYYISDESETGYVLIEFAGTPESTTIKAISQWTYDETSDVLVETNGWTEMWLQISGTSLLWTASEGEATSFILADPSELVELVIENDSDFNPLNVSYQPNATAEIPEVSGIDESKILTDLEMNLDAAYTDQLGDDVSASQAVTDMLTEISTTLSDAGYSMRYPIDFYEALRTSMLEQEVASTDIYNVKLGYANVPNVYFTNATDDLGEPHPFMVITSHAVSTRPNMLLDVNRPPGAEAGVQYAESTVTRHGKLGEFLMKIPIRDYGLIDELLDNDLSTNGDLASDYDDKNGATTTQDVYNYAGLASVGVAIDGVSIYPAYNNNLRFAVEDAEVTHSGIHVGGGLELHYHADGHAFNSNGFNLYNIADYEGKDHPPAIGIGYDGIALFGKYEESYSDMVGNNNSLDEYGGHDHGDGFGYHYHAHSQNVQSSDGTTTFDEHFLMVGAWRGYINDIPGFEEVKMNQFNDESIARYAGASYEPGTVTNSASEIDSSISVNPNPVAGFIRISVDENLTFQLYDMNGIVVKAFDVTPGDHNISFESISNGVYVLKAKGNQSSYIKRLIIK